MIIFSFFIINTIRNICLDIPKENFDLRRRFRHIFALFHSGIDYSTLVNGKTSGWKWKTLFLYFSHASFCPSRALLFCIQKSSIPLFVRKAKYKQTNNCWSIEDDFLVEIRIYIELFNFNYGKERNYLLKIVLNPYIK